MNREIFAHKLNEIVKETGIRQSMIASALGLSSAAISQFVHGTALPSTRQLRSLLTMLCLSSSRQREMLALLSAAKKELPPEITDGEDYESEEEDERDIFLDQTLLDPLFKQTEDDPVLNFASPDFGVPVINLADLLNFDSTQNLSDFAESCMQDTIIRDYGSLGDGVMLKADGKELGLQYDGMVLLVISDDVLKDVSSLQLSMYPDKRFAIESILKQKNSQADIVYGRDDIEDDLRPLWSFPILELNILPLQVKNWITGDII